MRQPTVSNLRRSVTTCTGEGGGGREEEEEGLQVMYRIKPEAVSDNMQALKCVRGGGMGGERGGRGGERGEEEGAAGDV